MKRRQFLAALGTGAAAAAVAKPAIAQSAPEVKWRLSSSFPKSLDTIYSGGETLAKFVAEATDNKFQIENFGAGEIVPGLQVLDAVTNSTVEMCHTAAYYFVGKDPTFAVCNSIPFGPNSRQQNAWFNDGGGNALINDFVKKFNIVAFPGGNTGTQMGGWFRKEINTVDDFKGLKFRIGGWAGKTITALGGVAQQIVGGDIYPALEKGVIDAAEWVGPYDDEKLGFFKIAPHYYYPGWWEGGPILLAWTNLDKWNSLPKQYQAVLEQAGAISNQWMMAKYDLANPPALKRLLANGVKLHAFSPEIMEACYKAAKELHADIASKNANFKKVYDSMTVFSDNSYQWFQVAELGYDSFMVRHSHG